MKKIFFILLILLSPQAISYSQWVQQNSGINGTLYYVFFANQNTGYSIGEALLKTTNGGTNWTSLTGSGTCIYFLNPDTGFLGYSVGTNSGIGKTTNGGLNFTITNLSLGSANSISFINALTGWAAFGIQGFGNIYKTTNGGINWFNVNTTQGQTYVKFFNANTGYAEGYYYGLRKSTDGGLTWSFVPQGAMGVVVYAIDTNIVYQASYSGHIYRTTNSGTSWDTLQRGVTTSVWSFSFPNSATGYAVGGYTNNQIILCTTNGGNNWVNTGAVNSSGLNSVCFINPSTGWAVGDNGTILKTTNGGGLVGIQPLSEQIPPDFHLYQNFPNPFNPETKIKFDLPPEKNKEAVKLVIYDILGNQIEQLVNELLDPGSYEVLWNASSFPSGIYFARVQTGNRTETIKMALLK